VREEEGRGSVRAVERRRREERGREREWERGACAAPWWEAACAPLWCLVVPLFALGPQVRERPRAWLRET